MKTSVKTRYLVSGCFTCFLSLTGCGVPGPECGSLESRSSVVKMIADDHNNALVNYAANNSSAVAVMVDNANVEADKLAILEGAKRGAVYKLDDTIHIESMDTALHAVTCSGALNVTVMDTTAHKAVTFSVTQTTEGKALVSVNPFLF